MMVICQKSMMVKHENESLEFPNKS